MMIKVLGRASSANVQKVVWALSELNMRFERVDVGGKFGGNRQDDYLAVNPNGTVPTLIDGDTTIWESNTILRYLANRSGRSTLYPTAHEAAARSQVERWMDWQLASLNPGITPLFQSLIRTPAERQQPDVIEQHRLRTLACLRVLDGVLARGNRADPHVCGTTFTLADITLGPQVHRWFELPIEREPLPALEYWYGRLCQRPAFAQHVMIGLS